MTTTRGRGRERTAARPTAASSPSWRGPSTVPSLDEQVAHRDVLAGGADVLARARAPGVMTTCATPRSVHS